MDCVYRRREDRRGRNPLDELPSNESALCVCVCVWGRLSLSLSLFSRKISRLAFCFFFRLALGLPFDFVDERGISDWENLALGDDYALSRQVLWVEKIVWGY